MKRIGLLRHPRIPESQDLARDIENALDGHEATVWIGSSWDFDAVVQHCPDLDLIITLGGDGTLVRVARTIAPVCSVPILGVNLGRLGFLAELEASEAALRIPAIVAGDHWIEERSMIRASVERASARSAVGAGIQSDETECAAQHDAAYHALNDAVVGRGSLARAVRVSTYVDGEFVTTYTADGVIVATATGSAAYSLSAGGPILAPELTDIVVTPIAPHLTILRSLVLPSSARIQLDVSTDFDAVLSLDGLVDLPLEKHDRITMSSSEHKARFVRTHPPAHFYRSLVQRLHKRIVRQTADA